MTDPQQPQDIRQKLNQETGKLSWPELVRFFAHGSVMVAGPDEDLVEIGARMAEDDAAWLKPLLDAGRLRAAGDEDARHWQARQPLFWTVVIAPWVLVQECKDAPQD